MEPPGHQSVGDPVNRAFPIGIGFRLTDEVALDLETIVGNPISPRGGTSVTNDSGIVHDAEAVVLGARIGRDIGGATHFKRIPLIPGRLRTWAPTRTGFVEAAFR